MTKRRTSGHDIVADRFGRYYQLAVALADLGHEVVVIAADYRGTREEAQMSGVRFVTIPLNPVSLPVFMSRAREVADSVGPDAVLGGGDTHLGLISWRLAQRLGRPFVFDVFDNYRSFASARIPGMKRALSAVLEGADLVVTVSQGLREMVPHDRVEVIPNGVDLSLFAPQLNVKAGAAGPQIVGYVGGVAADRGIGTLIEAVGALRSRGLEVRLVIAGPLSDGFSLPSHPWLDYLGILRQQEIPGVIGRLDVAVLPYPETEWARYTSPYKLLEYLACEVPVVVTDVSEFPSMVPSPHSVCRPNDAVDMCRAIAYQLENAVTTPRDPGWAWSARGKALAEELRVSVGIPS